jgi:histidinol-phosphatase
MGAWGDDRRLSVSGIASIADAQVSFNEPRTFASRGWGDAITALADRAWRVRGFGDFWHHMLVAEGAVDIAMEAVIAPWDMAACQIIVEEAGGRYTDLTGIPDYSTGSSLSTNGLLHDEVLALFNG